MKLPDISNDCTIKFLLAVACAKVVKYNFSGTDHSVKTILVWKPKGREDKLGYHRVFPTCAHLPGHSYLHQVIMYEVRVSGHFLKSFEVVLKMGVEKKRLHFRPNL